MLCCFHLSSGVQADLFLFLPETCSEQSCGIAIQSILVQYHLPRVFIALNICLNSFNTVPRRNDAGLSHNRSKAALPALLACPPSSSSACASFSSAHLVILSWFQSFLPRLHWAIVLPSLPVAEPFWNTSPHSI